MIPTREEAEKLLIDGEKCNPGPWGDHSRTAAHCAEKIALYSGLDPEKAYIFGLLHDIGRKFGKRHLGHVSDGYSYMMSLGYDEVAKICLTHSFKNGNSLKGYVGKIDTSEEETNLILDNLKKVEFDDYDCLIQLCDAIAGADGVMDIVDRMSDVKRRYGSYDQEKWDANIALKESFEKRMGRDLYEAVEKDTFRPQKALQNDQDKKTLYVSDLDGTLLRSDISLSEYTVSTINALVEKGMAFTYATARSIESARKLTSELKLKLPVVTRNGAVLADNTTGKVIEKAVFNEDEVKLLKELLPELPFCGFVSCFVGEKMIKNYVSGEHSVGLNGYIDYHNESGHPLIKVDDMESLFCGEPGYVTLIDDEEFLYPVYERAKEYQGWECVFSKDTYRDEYWLEICPRNCTKAKTLLKLKERYGFEKLVVFGDSVNDIPMFKLADEAYAVKDALDDLKLLATDVIGSNNDDAVAKYLQSVSR